MGAALAGAAPLDDRSAPFLPYGQEFSPPMPRPQQIGLALTRRHGPQFIELDDPWTSPRQNRQENRPRPTDPPLNTIV